MFKYAKELISQESLEEVKKSAKRWVSQSTERNPKKLHSSIRKSFVVELADHCLAYAYSFLKNGVVYIFDKEEVEMKVEGSDPLIDTYKPKDKKIELENGFAQLLVHPEHDMYFSEDLHKAHYLYMYERWYAGYPLYQWIKRSDIPSVHMDVTYDLVTTTGSYFVFCNDGNVKVNFFMDDRGKWRSANTFILALIILGWLSGPICFSSHDVPSEFHKDEVHLILTNVISHYLTTGHVLGKAMSQDQRCLNVIKTDILRLLARFEQWMIDYV